MIIEKRQPNDMILCFPTQALSPGKNWRCTFHTVSPFAISAFHFAQSFPLRRAIRSGSDGIAKLSPTLDFCAGFSRQRE